MKKLIFILINIFFSIYLLKSQNAVVAAEKMNVLYVGMDNPISIAAPNIPNDKLIVTVDNQATIQKIGDGKYNVRVIHPGQVVITIEANGKITNKVFRVKVIPDPIPKVICTRRIISQTEDLTTTEGLMALLMNFDINAKCSIQSYTIIIRPKTGEIYEKQITGAVLPEDVKAHFKMLKPNDVVNFTTIRARCPGDLVARDLGALKFIVE